ncbi:hypothetical protein MKW98_021342 [Papaver atlanticum]|uniref:protein-serine/threonine phosphatase n=1 Tax=Papaver atlanticum TaxID=357466 RepID=A0AAD4SRI1_9MAGN|nr:hypothetical protein MKW98_021342 [Papaver atlanticum]
MGLCMSVPSIDDQMIENEYKNNLLFIEDNNNSQRSSSKFGIASLYSQVGTKELNQDSALFYQGFGKEGGEFFGVFDGHGENGHKVSNLVINRLPKLLLEQERYRLCNYDESELVNIYKPNEWRRDCVSAFKIMDKEIKLQKDFDSSCSGTTAVTIIKQDQDLVIANLGDSRAVLGRISDGELKAVQLTIDHKPNLPKEAERIRKCGGRVIPHKGEPDVHRVWSADDDYMSLAMARAFGDFHLKDYGVIAIPQITHIRLTNEDQFLVLATDGVWDVLTNDEVASIVWSIENKEVAARAVVKAASAAWRHDYPSSKVDDITVVCLFLQDRKQDSNFLSKENLSTAPPSEDET